MKKKTQILGRLFSQFLASTRCLAGDAKWLVLNFVRNLTRQDMPFFKIRSSNRGYYSYLNLAPWWIKYFISVVRIIMPCNYNQGCEKKKQLKKIPMFFCFFCFCLNRLFWTHWKNSFWTFFSKNKRQNLLSMNIPR